MKIIQMLCPKNKYNVKVGGEMDPECITVHNTANDASALREISYMISNNNYVSYHYAVDDIQSVQGLPLNVSAWHAGDGRGPGNSKSIAVEICYSKSGGDQYTKAEDNAVDLIVYLLKRYNWGVDRVKKHQDWSGKYCPHRILDDGWGWFINKVIDRFKEVENVDDTLNTKPVDQIIYRVRKSWEDVASQIGAYVNLDNAKRACESGYKVYDPNGVIIYPEQVTNTQPTSPTVIVTDKKTIITDWNTDVIYQVYANNRWYPPVNNLNDYAGDGKNPIKAIAIKTTFGSVEYRVHVKSAGRWYPYVTGYDLNDIANGYAGDCRNDIDAVEVYFNTPSGYSYKKAIYRVAPIGRSYYYWQIDREIGNMMDGYAGSFGTSIGKFQIIIR